MSAPWPSRRSIISIQLLTQLGVDLGLSLDRCLQETGLSPVQLSSLNGEIEAHRELQLIANLVEALPAVADLGLQAGRRYHVTSYGAWGYAILSSATVRQAAELGLRYHGLTYAFTRISLSVDDTIANLNFDDSALPPRQHDFIVQEKHQLCAGDLPEPLADLGQPALCPFCCRPLNYEVPGEPAPRPGPGVRASLLFLGGGLLNLAP